MTITPTSRKPGKQRIMVQLWGTLAKAIERDFKALNLKRDRYLNDLFAREIEELATEVTFRNSDEVRARIQEHKLPNRVRLTIELDATLVVRIDAVLREKNIPRDAFVNRVLFFLVAKEPLLDMLGVEFDDRASASAKPLADAQGYLYDPFFHIRSANEGRFYTMPWFPQGPVGANGGANLFGMTTAIDERSWDLMNISADEMLAEMLSLLPEDSHADH